MTSRAEYLALAERAERATAHEQHALIREVVIALERGDLLDLVNAGAYLDAVVSLVPEGWRWWVNWQHARCWKGWRLQEDGNTADEDAWCSVNGGPTTPALALVAAALRARAEEAKDGE